MASLFAKITPAAEFVISASPFNRNIKTCEYLTARLNRYQMGGGEEEIFCEVLFGEFVPAIPREFLEKFETYGTVRVKFTSDELNDWGTDDSVILNKIAEKLGIEIVEILEKSKVRIPR